MGDAKLLLARLHYSPEDGTFRWREGGSRQQPAGKLAGSIGKSGYARIRYGSRQYLSHRLAILALTGSWPDGEVDHINGDKSDNRACNLRVVTREQNQQNLRAARRDNQCGHLGVSRSGRRWQARIDVSGVQKYLGTFSTPEEAHGAYVAAKRLLHSTCSI